MLALAACHDDPTGGATLVGTANAQIATDAPSAASAPPPSSLDGAAGAAGEAGAATRRGFVLLAGGDVELARAMGKKLLREPAHDPLKTLDGWLRSADLRFVNLESQLSEQGGQTVSPQNRLVFTGPPIGAEALSRAGIEVVSTANNHAWDYGKRALLETLDNLDRVGVQHVGTGADLERAQAPVVVERGGMKIGFLAATDIWNQGHLSLHEGRYFVAGADAAWMVPAVRALKEQGVDVVAVSYHGGEEYRDTPLPRAKRLHEALIDAGADVVIGHHPHVLQGVGFYRGRPIFYSLGNLLMQMHRDHVWTGTSMMVRLHFSPGGEPPSVEVCPLRMLGLEPRPLHREPAPETHWAMFAGRLRSLSAATGGVQLGEPGADGCAPLSGPSR